MALLGKLRADRLRRPADTPESDARRHFQGVSGTLLGTAGIVVMLADVEELSYEEIAEAAQIPVGTVKSRLYRGRRQVQKLLWEYMQEGQTT